MTDPIRILVVDDHLVVREGLRMILETEPGYEIVGEAADGVAALEEVARLRPQVMLMDLRMPRLDGLATLARMTREAPEVAVVVLTTFNSDFRGGDKRHGEPLLTEGERATGSLETEDELGASGS